MSGSAAGASGWACNNGTGFGARCTLAGNGAVYKLRTVCFKDGNSAVGLGLGCYQVGAVAAGTVTPCGTGNSPVTRTGGNACLVGGGG